MKNKLQVPPEAVKYILFQRTNYLRFSNSIFYKAAHKIFPDISYKLLITLESRIFKDQIIYRYAESMQNEYASIKDFLPSKCETVLDIGCGVAGVDPYFSWHYKNPIQFFLLDKTFTDNKVVYKYREKASFYNSLLVAKKLLTLNGIDDTQIHLIEANDEYAIPIKTHIDLVISLLAWGFHFPVSTYLNQVLTNLQNDGTLIIDISKESDGINELQRKFQTVNVIREKKDHIRIFARKIK